MTRIYLFFILCIYTSISYSKDISVLEYQYETPTIPWSESYGNHRAILSVRNNGDFAFLHFNWRRSDKEVGNKAFIIVNAESGDTVRNILRVKVNNEKCELYFGPVKQGKYYFYYLPYRTQEGHGFYYKGYLEKESIPNEEWKSQLKSAKNNEAKVLKVEARTHFDSFYPMEITADTSEKVNYLNNYKNKKMFLFPEHREKPIRMKRDIPYFWMNQQQNSTFKAKVQPNEYFAFQVGIWSPYQELRNIQYKISDLKSKTEIIPASKITCFNTEGVNPDGFPFIKTVNITKGTVQALWFGIDLDRSLQQGKYYGTLSICSEGELKEDIPLEIDVVGEVLVDRGDSETWRHSRLRWLNSTLGINDEPTDRYIPIVKKDNAINILGRKIILDPKNQLPAYMKVWGKDLLSDKITFELLSEGKKMDISMDRVLQNEVGKSIYRYTGIGSNAKFNLKLSSKIECDGWLNFLYEIEAKEDTHIDDIKLVIPFNKEQASYMMGMGLPGQAVPSDYEGKWDSPTKIIDEAGVSIPTSKTENQLYPFDSFWLGSASSGIHCELRGTSYSGPLLNLYKPSYPESWNNGGKGGFKIKKNDNSCDVVVYSGDREVKKGEVLKFEFSLIVTPIKELDLRSQFDDRYYHNGNQPIPTQIDVDAGIKIINIHHANEFNPFINYPFLTVDKLRNFVKQWHSKDCKVKLYYTVRELTNVTTEIWALRSLGDEILRGGNGGGYPWCREHFDSDYTPQWYQHFDHLDFNGISADASVLTAEGESRWLNYYIEGLAWMVKNVDIDGLYLDDVSFDRRILKRMRKAMDQVKKGCVIDLHSNTGFSKGPANQYTEFFPYIDKIWFGESFMYDIMTPENWLVESSGIPFGLMGDMLHGGGNKWLGMQYGMTVRHPWLTEGVVCDPTPVWGIWDEFKIGTSTMYGFWSEHPLVKTSDSRVKATSYLNEDKKVLVSLGNYSDETLKVVLDVYELEQKLNKKAKKLLFPYVKDFQDEKELEISSVFEIPSRKGYLIYIQFE